MPINLPSDIAIDIRDPILGDSYNWNGLEPAPAKKQIVIHATASQAPDEDGFTMAEYHVNHNGWSGIGVHAVVTKDAYPGRPGYTPAGAQVQYVGDLLTWRAGVANNNYGKVHIEISGLFTPGNGVPSEGQLRATRKFIDFLLAPNNLLPSLNFYSQVSYHNAVAIQPGGATECPGWQHPQFNEWFSYLQGGAEPSWFAQPAPPPPAATVVVAPADPTSVDERPEWERTWTPETVSPKVVAVPSADVFDFVAGQVTKTLPGGEPIAQIAGIFSVKNVTYVRTQWSVDHGKWNGIMLGELKDPEAPVGVGAAGTPVDGISHPTIQIPYEPVPVEVPVITPANQPEVDTALGRLWAALGGLVLSPLRLIGLITNFLEGLKK